MPSESLVMMIPSFFCKVMDLIGAEVGNVDRSEERRVGKEC